jgi:hypothetical protein
MDRLTISSIETVPIRVPLARTFSGSYYRMTHRSTIVTRVHTQESSARPTPATRTPTCSRSTASSARRSLRV